MNVVGLSVGEESGAVWSGVEDGVLGMTWLEKEIKQEAKSHVRYHCRNSLL
jgi:hypothetical protein